MDVCGDGEWPDVGDGGCCIGAAVYGAHRCTCWEPVYDREQADPDTSAPFGLGPEGGCVDCAYRPGSPERAGDERVRGDQADLERLVATGQPFSCHQGMRRPMHYVHPSGATFTPPGLEHAYAPARGSDGRWYKADGTPADLCSGWAARRAVYLRDHQNDTRL